jgi:NADH:ubiquinone oxidoreductase subunit F (NADH-binding)
LAGGGLASDIDMLVALSHQMTGLNLCPLGDSIEPFLASVVKRFKSQFYAYIKTMPTPPALEPEAVPA